MTLDEKNRIEVRLMNELLNEDITEQEWVRRCNDAYKLYESAKSSDGSGAGGGSDADTAPCGSGDGDDGDLEDDPLED